jgi:AcrR family transcriptional regulator
MTDARPMRADARRNREKLLAVAVEMLSHTDSEVPLEAMAKRAGVGIGTLYRHFPTRADLVEAVYRQEVDRVCHAVDELLAELPPDRALRAWMDRFVTYFTTKHGMASALRAAVSSESTLFGRTYQQLIASLDTLLRAGVAAGTIRADIEAADVLQALAGAWSAAEMPNGSERAGRLLDLLMDGLRYGAAGSGERPFG